MHPPLVVQPAHDPEVLGHLPQPVRVPHHLAQGAVDGGDVAVEHGGCRGGRGGGGGGAGDALGLEEPVSHALVVVEEGEEGVRQDLLHAALDAWPAALKGEEKGGNGSFYQYMR